MKKLILKTTAFVALLILLYTTFLFLPSTPRASKSLLFSAIKKDSLLQNVPAPRIIFVGGSGLSFGLNSKIIKDSLQINPINTSIHALLGLKYMLENTMKYVQKGDILVLVPEYLFYYNHWNRGSQELFRTIVEVNRDYLELLDYNCFQYSGYYVASKFNPLEYFGVKESAIYSVNSFNEFGDANAHWTLPKESLFIDKPTNVADYNPEIMENIQKIAHELQAKGCTLLISYPAYQESSFNNSIQAVRKVEQEYLAHNFTILGTPERYKIPDSLLFGGLYHLNKQGVDLRTHLLIQDLKPFVSPPPPSAPANTSATTPSPPQHTANPKP